MATTHDPHRLIGTTLGRRFELTTVVATDEAGAMYEASDSELLSPATVRVLHHIRPDDSSLRRLLELLTEVSNLSLPGLKPLRAVGRTRAQDVYYAVDEVRGEPLAQRFDQGHLKVDEVVEIIAAAGEVLGRVHLNGLVHAALHPGAIIVSAQRKHESVFLIDFGLGPLMVGEQVVSAEGATTPYKAPEQAKGEPYDHRADIYSLGALLFEGLTGRAPYAGSSALEVLAHQLRGEAPKLSEVDPSFEGSPLQEVVDKAMAINVAERYSATESLVAALRSAARSEAMRSKPLPGKRAAKPKAKAKASTKQSSAKDRKPDKKTGAKTERKIASLKAHPVPEQRNYTWYLIGTALVIGSFGALIYLILGPTGDVVQQATPPAQIDTTEDEEEPIVKRQRPRRPRPPEPGDDEERVNPAIEAAIKAQSEPLPPRALENIELGQEALLERRYSTAIARFRSAKRAAPTSPEVARGLGLAYMYAGQTEPAADELERYLELAPNAADASRMRSTIITLRE